MSGLPYNPQPGYTPPAHDNSGMKFAILFGAVIALIAANIFLYLQIDNLKQQTAKMQESILNEVGRVRETESVTSAAARKNIQDLQTDLSEARRQASQAAGQAKIDATKRAEELAAKLATQQQQQKQELQSQISKVDEAATSKIGQVSSDVSNVKTEVSANKSELDKTIADLHSTKGDLGVQSGLIATNGKELAALRALNDRNYFEFTLPRKSKAPQRVGDIMLQLKNVDPKKNRFTVNVSADDKVVEKRDKGVNEPIQFYTSKARQPYEIVVNSVKKDQIAGYLATPKVQGGR
jgi:F0F1-type ATP synthase membrane subunit b/b'